MKKRLYVLMAAMLCMLMILAGCNAKTTAVAMETAEDGLSASIIFDKADEGDFVMGGTLEVAEGQKLVIDKDIEEGGSAAIRFIDAGSLSQDEDADTDELAESADTDKYVLEDIVSDKGTDEFGIDPGSYYIRVEVKSADTTGTANIKVE